MAGNRGRGSRHHARSILGEGAGQIRNTLPQLWTQSTKRLPLLGFPNSNPNLCQLSRTSHLAATELTVMVSPSKVPVTAAFLPACLSSVVRAALSLVSKI